MGPVERLTPAASNPVVRVEPQSRERRRRQGGDTTFEEHDESPGSSKPEPTRDAGGEGFDALLDPDAPGRRIDIKA